MDDLIKELESISEECSTHKNCNDCIYGNGETCKIIDLLNQLSENTPDSWERVLSIFR